MIVITSLKTKPYYVEPGDEFRLRIGTANGTEDVIKEEITVEKTIDFVASYRFADEDGSCRGFHLNGFFGNSAELPQEMKEAKQLSDLTPEQLERFIATSGIEVTYA